MSGATGTAVAMGTDIVGLKDAGAIYFVILFLGFCFLTLLLERDVIKFVIRFSVCVRKSQRVNFWCSGLHDSKVSPVHLSSPAF